MCDNAGGDGNSDDGGGDNAGGDGNSDDGGVTMLVVMVIVMMVV